MEDRPEEMVTTLPRLAVRKPMITRAWNVKAGMIFRANDNLLRHESSWRKKTSNAWTARYIAYVSVTYTTVKKCILIEAVYSPTTTWLPGDHINHDVPHKL